MGYYLDEVEVYLFNDGSNAYAYRALGCHLVKRGRAKAHRFAVWAPNAQGVSVVGDFNNWDASAYPMNMIGDTGVWQTHIPNLENGFNYKFAITTNSGNLQLKADPFAFSSELRPGSASRICNLSGYKWKDARWLRKRRNTPPYDRPINIYEMHLGSWRGEKNYRDIAEDLAQYAADMGYTHVEFMPLAEYPLDMSWGYQITGYFSATARYGSPQDLMYLIDTLHQAGIGVIMDWVPGHFPRDEYGLRRFDGTPCYEHPDPAIAESQWGTLQFDYGRGEVRSFLLSNAMFWLDVFHVDGLRADAVSSMLYLNYCKEGERARNRFGGEENLEAISFIKKCSELIFRDFPNTLFCAEEATSFPLVTRPTHAGGLGFNYKWSMGWMHDTLEYMALDPLARKHHHNLVTFSMYYSFSENFILSISHDEVVHGKKSLLDKMSGDYWQKFANMRLFMAFMMAHPGKKLIFMGAEIGQFIEWRYYEPLEWKLLAYDAHRQLQHFFKTINHYYLKHPSLYELEDSWAGFEWLSVDDHTHSILALARHARATDNGPGEMLCAIFNFTPVVREGYRIGVPRAGYYTEALNTDAKEFGGSGVVNKDRIVSQPIPWNNRAESIALTLPPLGAVFLWYKPLSQAALAARTQAKDKISLLGSAPKNAYASADGLAGVK